MIPWCAEGEPLWFCYSMTALPFLLAAISTALTARYRRWSKEQQRIRKRRRLEERRRRRRARLAQLEAEAERYTR